jgi:hypothetical protein
MELTRRYGFGATALPDREGGVRALPSLARDFARTLPASRRLRGALAGVERYVMFVGYPRSGHSLIGSLLTAHPDAVVAHEADALRYVRARFPRGQLFALLLERDRAFGDTFDRAIGRYDYRVPGQWQGRVRRLRVIGDKKGGASTGRLRRAPELLDRLRATVGLPLRIVHVTRSPFDNIAAIHKLERERKGFTLARSVDFYFELAQTNAELEARVDAREWLGMAHEDFVGDPATCLARLCEFVGLDLEPGFLADCAGIVYPSAHRTRVEAPWTSELIEAVRRRSRELPFLARYAEDECPAAALA